MEIADELNCPLIWPIWLETPQNLRNLPVGPTPTSSCICCFVGSAYLISWKQTERRIFVGWLLQNDGHKADWLCSPTEVDFSRPWFLFQMRPKVTDNNCITDHWSWYYYIKIWWCVILQYNVFLGWKIFNLHFWDLFIAGKFASCFFGGNFFSIVIWKECSSTEVSKTCQLEKKVGRNPFKKMDILNNPEKQMVGNAWANRFWETV